MRFAAALSKGKKVQLQSLFHALFFLCHLLFFVLFSLQNSVKALTRKGTVRERERYMMRKIVFVENLKMRAKQKAKEKGDHGQLSL